MCEGKDPRLLREIGDLKLEAVSIHSDEFMTQQENSVAQTGASNLHSSEPIDRLFALLVDLDLVEPPIKTVDVQATPTQDQALTQSQAPDRSRTKLDDIPPPSPLVITDQVRAAVSESVKAANVLPSVAFEAAPIAPVPQRTTDRDEATLDETAVLEQLQTLLVGSNLAEFRALTTQLQQQLASLEHQIYEPAALMTLLLPWIAELLTRKVAESQEEVVQAIAPIIDQIIQNRGEQNKVAMSAALSPLIAAAIAQQTNHSPEEIASAIAPTIGRAVKEQILLEQDVMVDALYPIIGSTIAKYMAEALQAINQQVETTLSPEGIRRKIRAKLQGVSEAELILKAAMPFTVQAIFLIHKASGLLIADIQPDGDRSLESEMVAGMLTAIRSFASECMTQTGAASELDQIDYSGAKIILEVAGYCYLAVVVQGDPPRSFILKLRQTLRGLVKHYGKELETFDGDPATVPAAVQTNLEALRNSFTGDRLTDTARPPILLVGLLGLLGLIGIPFGIAQYQQSVAHQAEATTALALASAPSLAVYRLDVNASGGTLKLTGRVPNAVLRWQAEQIASRAAPSWTVANEILAVDVPPDALLTAAEVKRVTALLNQTHGVAIATRYATGRVWVEGRSETIAPQAITQAFANIPGVRSVTNTVAIPPAQIPIRIFFKAASATVPPVDQGYKLEQVRSFLQRYPNQAIRIVGHSDPADVEESQTLALQRASAVHKALVSQGVEPKRLQVWSATAQDADETFKQHSTQPSWQHRYVEFEPIAPVVKRHEAGRLE